MNQDLAKHDFLSELIPEKLQTAGGLIRSMRITLGLTQEELGEITGIDKTNISSYENNRKKIGKDVADKLAAALGCMPQSILYPDGTYKKTRELINIEKKAQKLFASKR